MKFTPLGKFFLFLVGLAIIATAVRLYVPKEKLPWPKRGERRAEPAPEPRTRPDDTTSSQVSRQSEPARPAPPATAPAQGSWAKVSGGRFASGPEANDIDVPAFEIQRTEVTNGDYDNFVVHCP